MATYSTSKRLIVSESFADLRTVDTVDWRIRELFCCRMEKSPPFYTSFCFNDRGGIESRIGIGIPDDNYCARRICSSWSVGDEVIFNQYEWSSYFNQVSTGTISF